MQNLWSDSDAKARSPATPPGHRRGSRAARLHDAAAGRRAEAGAAWRRQHLGEDADRRTSPARPIDVLCVKGSGWDMGTIEAPGLPAVRLAPLQRAARAAGAVATRTWSTSSAATCSTAKSPNPSVETLLHAFLPHKFIDHTHSNAVLALTDQPDGEALAADVYGKRAALVPYVMPGFALAKKCSEVGAGQSRRRGPDPAEARHLLDGRDGRGSLRPHDRPGDHGRAAARPGDAQDLPGRRRCRATARDRRPRSRRSCAG